MIVCGQTDYQRKPGLLKWSEATVLGMILLAPSIWMLSVIPPL